MRIDSSGSIQGRSIVSIASSIGLIVLLRERNRAPLANLTAEEECYDCRHRERRSNYIQAASVTAPLAFQPADHEGSNESAKVADGINQGNARRSTSSGQKHTRHR